MSPFLVGVGLVLFWGMPSSFEVPKSLQWTSVAKAPLAGLPGGGMRLERPLCCSEAATGWLSVDRESFPALTGARAHGLAQQHLLQPRPSLGSCAQRWFRS